MITFHGWATIREAYEESKESPLAMQKIWEELNGKAKKINSDDHGVFLDLRILNGEYSLTVHGSANHKSSTWHEIFELYSWLAKNAVGSYGLLHLHDDEDATGLENNFQVHVLKKGVLTKEIESHLSPVVPGLEGV